MTIRRREFLTMSAAVSATALLGPWLNPFTEKAEWQKLMTAGPAKVTPTVCNICFWACAGQVHQRGGKPWKVTGHPDDEHSHGRLCTRGTAGLGSYVDPDRLVKPLMRVEQNGKQAFKPVSWDKALDFVAGKMKKIAKEHGPDRLALIAHGSGASLFGHLVRAYGSGSIAYPSFAQCRGPRDTGFFLTFGEGIASPEQTDMSNAECIVLVGSHIGENLHNGQVHEFAAGLKNNATLITVDPRFSVAASKSKYWLPIKPGTDIALMLAWINVIMAERLYDAEYIQRHTIGFESLAKYIAPFTPEWAYTETGLDPEQIRRTAHVMAAAAPATMLHPGRHSTWYGDDTQRARAMAILAGLLGIWGRKGGYYLPEKVALPEYPTPAYPKPKSTWRDVTSARFPLAGQGVTGAIVGASVGADAHYKGWIVYGTNLPMTMPAAREQLKKAAQQLELFVAVDTMPAEITGYADVVLPECTYLERYDPLRNEDEREPSLALRAPAFKPLGESTPAWWMARELGLRLGLDKYFPWKDYKEVLDWQLKQVGSSLAEMEKLGMKKFPRKTPLYFPDDGAIKFKTANGKIQLYSELLAKYGFDALPRYTPPKQLPDGYLHLNYGR
ncbi:MAG: molybdopterin-dependent oxidoreductase, partial [Pseudolabrys sp.]